jgi:hypothetical protein
LGWGIFTSNPKNWTWMQLQRNKLQLPMHDIAIFWTLYVLFICSNLATDYCHASDAILRFETPSCQLQTLLHESLQDPYSILQLLRTY